jgi:hypothetical protein
VSFLLRWLLLFARSSVSLAFREWFFLLLQTLFLLLAYVRWHLSVALRHALRLWAVESWGVAEANCARLLSLLSRDQQPLLEESPAMPGMQQRTAWVPTAIPLSDLRRRLPKTPSRGSIRLRTRCSYDSTNQPLRCEA